MSARKRGKWLPFYMLLGTALGFSVYLIFFGGNGAYRPQTDDPALIYRQACMECHGAHGEGNGLLYPAFNKWMDEEDVAREIREGNWRMPAFRYIRNDTLAVLARYVAGRKFETEK